MKSSTTFNSKLEQILLESDCDEYDAAVAVVQKGNKWLLGLSTATYDDRNKRWCFPGGGIKKGEDTKKAAARECKEETGIRCKPVGEPFTHGNKKGVAFVHCRATGNQKFNNNPEFSALGWFTLDEMKALKLYKNVRALIRRV